MSNITKLKRKAAEYEQRRQYDRALAAYVEVLEESGPGDEVDISLYNRVGDLHLRVGNMAEAIRYYEKAVDLYAENGFFNNAIALCNKILRHSPGRSSIFYKLGKISAKKGFNSDAKQNFLEYADRMQKEGKIDEAFRALKEFADLCPGQDDIRLMLAEQLTRANRKTEALEQLHILYENFDAEGRGAEASATLERMRAIDPAVQPRKSDRPRQQQSDGLIFLDIGYTSPAQALEGLEHTSLAEPLPAAPAPLDIEPTAIEDSIPRRTEPTSPAEFAQMDLPAPADRPRRRDSKHDLVLADLPPLDEIAPASSDVLPIIEPPASVGSIDLSDLPLTLPDDSAIAGLSSGISDPQTVTFEPPEQGTEGGNQSLPFIIDPPAVPDIPHHVDPSATGEVPISPVQPPTEPVAPAAERSTVYGDRDDEFVDLGDWLRESEAPKSTRMIATDRERRDDEQADFSEMLTKFKAGVAANVEAEDYDSHYDLGVAYKEMGLLDEAIAEFQKALRGTDNRIRAYEALGQCFIEKGQFQVAVTLLTRAVREPDLSDEALVGVLYLMGYAAEAMKQYPDAVGYYQRVFAVDIEFRDVAERLKTVSQFA